MTLTDEERKALALFRKIHQRQREKILLRMERDVIANKVVKRLSKSKILEFAEDRTIERAFGDVPTWRNHKCK